MVRYPFIAIIAFNDRRIFGVVLYKSLSSADYLDKDMNPIQGGGVDQVALWNSTRDAISSVSKKYKYRKYVNNNNYVACLEDIKEKT